MIRKPIWIFATVSLLMLLMQGCKDDVNNAGASALMDGEEVIVCSDTIRDISSAIYMADPLCFTPDSFLLGECTLPHFGTISADILAQFAAPSAFVYPDSSVVDSAVLYLTYRSYVGDGRSPLAITVYEMDGEMLQYGETYTSDADISRFCSMNSRVSRRDPIILPGSDIDTTYSSSSSTSYVNAIAVPLTDDFCKKLFAIRDLSDRQAFLEAFKGLYITTNYGSSACLYILDISLGLHYHYFYPETEGSSRYIRQEDTKMFYTNAEVRQLNRLHYAERTAFYQQLLQQDSVNYVVSPAYLYTKVRIPVRDIVADIRKNLHSGDSDLRPYVNLSDLRIKVLNYGLGATADNDWAAPATSMLLVKEDAFDRFFGDHPVLSDTSAMYSYIKSEIDSVSGDLEHFYSFSMNSILTYFLRDTTQMVDTLNMLLVPVDITTTSSSSTSSSSSATTIVSIKQSSNVSVTKLRSAQHPGDPMNIEIVYSGFSDVRL
ncbi:MAG: DUF4270 domain-containing protein [Paludibacteraceae bacterium]|nr:DUF4270 domain-containing protein [Paludibacteraceae bacterium]